MIGVIAKHESASLLRLPVTWIISALLTCVFAFLFLQQLEVYLTRQAELALLDHPPGLTAWLATRFVAPASIVTLILGPLFAMRSFSDEFRLDTLSLWQSSPISTTALVLGKFLGVTAVLCAALSVTLLMFLGISLVGTLDWLQVGSAMLGLYLLAAACAATGLFFSSLTRHAMVAVLASLATLALVWLIGTSSFNSVPVPGIQQSSLANHIGSFHQGYIASNDMLYFVLYVALFLALTVIRLDALRHMNR